MARLTPREWPVRLQKKCLNHENTEGAPHNMIFRARLVELLQIDHDDLIEQASGN